MSYPIIITIKLHKSHWSTIVIHNYSLIIHRKKFVGNKTLIIVNSCNKLIATWSYHCRAVPADLPATVTTSGNRAVYRAFGREAAPCRGRPGWGNCWSGAGVPRARCWSTTPCGWSRRVRCPNRWSLGGVSLTSLGHWKKYIYIFILPFVWGKQVCGKFGTCPEIRGKYVIRGSGGS